MQVRCASRVKELRIRQGWVQAELAIAAGVSERTVQRVESGAASALSTVRAIAAAFAADVADLIDEVVPSSTHASQWETGQPQPFEVYRLVDQDSVAGSAFLAAAPNREALLSISDDLVTLEVDLGGEHHQWLNRDYVRTGSHLMFPLGELSEAIANVLFERSFSVIWRPERPEIDIALGEGHTYYELEFARQEDGSWVRNPRWTSCTASPLEVSLMNQIHGVFLAAREGCQMIGVGDSP